MTCKRVTCTVYFFHTSCFLSICQGVFKYKANSCWLTWLYCCFFCLNMYQHKPITWKPVSYQIRKEIKLNDYRHVLYVFQRNAICVYHRSFIKSSWHSKPHTHRSVWRRLSFISHLIIAFAFRNYSYDTLLADLVLYQIGILKS